MRLGSSSSRPSRTKLWRTARKQNMRIETKKEMWPLNIWLATRRPCFQTLFILLCVRTKKWRNLTKCWAWHVNVDSKHRRITKFKILFFFLLLLFLALTMLYPRTGWPCGCGGHMSTRESRGTREKNQRRMDLPKQKGSQNGRMWDVTVKRVHFKC